MPSQMPSSLKALLFLPFALLAVKSVAVAFLVMGPTDSVLNQVKAPEAAQAVTAMAQPAVTAPAGGPGNQPARGPF